MNFINRIKEKNSIATILYIILLINFIPIFATNAFFKEPMETSSILEIICYLTGFILLVFFYFQNRKLINISKNKIIVLSIICFIKFLVQIKNFFQNDFYIKDILDIGCFFSDIALFFILFYDFKVDEKSIKLFFKGIIYFSIMAIIWNFCLFNKEILAQFGIINENMQYTYIDNPKGFFVNRNTLAFFIFLAIISDAILINLDGEKKVYKFVFFILWFGVWCTHSKTAYIITVLFTELYILLNDKYNFKKKIIICTCIGILSILGFLNIMGRIPYNLQNDIKVKELVVSDSRIKQLSGRKGLWICSINFLNKSPFNWIFGVGKFNSRKILMLDGKQYLHCHNLYLEFLITGGIIELIYIFYAFMLIVKKILASDLKKIYKKIYSIMYILYSMYIILESFGKISIGFEDLLCLIFFISIPLLHANSIKKDDKEEENNE